VHISMFNDNFIMSTNDAFLCLESNTGFKYKWYPVRTDCGNIIELGGNNKELKAEILEIKENKIQTYDNGYVKDVFAIKLEQHKNFTYSEFMTNDRRSSTNKFKSKEELIKFLNTEKRLNYKQAKFVPVYETILRNHVFECIE
jgi:hypothetical protein